MIHFHNVTKRYGSCTALDTVSFRIEEKDIIGLLGPNGAGKTTLMKLITCVLPVSQGEIQVSGLSTVTDSLAIRSLIGYLPEDLPLYTEFSVKDYLNFLSQIRELKGSDKTTAIDRVVDRCDLSKVFYQPIGTLSKGFRQRVGLAQALLHDPSLLLLDEPTNGLDPQQKAEFRSVLASFQGTKTILILFSYPF